MSIQTLKDTGADYLVTSNMDGAVYRMGTEDCIVEGLGDEFTLTSSASSLQVNFASGSECVIAGNFFRLMESTDILLPASSTCYICARIDAAQASGATGSFAVLTSADLVQTGNINEGGGSKRDLLLYIVTTTSSGVDQGSIVDKRFIKKSNNNMIVSTLTAGSTTLNFTSASARKLLKNAAFSIYTDKYGVNPVSVVQNANGGVVVKFEAQDSDMMVGVHIDGTY